MTGSPAGSVLAVKHRRARASDPSTQPEHLSDLANDASAVVRQAAAQNPSTPHEALLRLATDPRRAVRGSVLANPAATVDILTAMISDPYRQIRWALPMHPRHGLTMQHRIAASPDPTARRDLGGHPDLAPDVTARLAADTDPRVRAEIAARTTDPDLFAVLLADPSRLVRVRALTNPVISPDQVRRLAADPSAHVRATLAFSYHHRLAADVLEALARDTHPTVRYQLLMGWTLQPPPVKQALREDPDPQIRAAAIRLSQGHRTPDDIRAAALAAARDTPDPSQPDTG